MTIAKRNSPGVGDFVAKYWKLFLGFALLGFGVFAILSTICFNLALKKYGVCTKGVLTGESIRHRGGDYFQKYQVYINSEEYTGNSNEEYERARIGDSICVVYLESLPIMNRAVKYFDEGEIKCGCR